MKGTGQDSYSASIPVTHSIAIQIGRDWIGPDWIGPDWTPGTTLAQLHVQLTLSGIPGIQPGSNTRRASRMPPFELHGDRGVEDKPGAGRQHA